jgi:hypothetical protein
VQVFATEADAWTDKAMKDARTGKPKSQFNFPFLNLTPGHFSRTPWPPVASRSLRELAGLDLEGQ